MVTTLQKLINYKQNIILRNFKVTSLCFFIFMKEGEMCYAQLQIKFGGVYETRNH